MSGELVERLASTLATWDRYEPDGQPRVVAQANDMAEAIRAILPTLQAQERRIGELQGKMRMIVSHATGGDSTDIDAGVNDICVRISAMRNHVYQAGKDQADKEAGRLTTGGGHDGQG